ncbi:uncharacterized protein TNIN_337551 [Trichonephila inaurata madagascariensis]|uniref:Uncharacterized protein n=1 Tax=Trichonephila inaurata madagascariensis TaxID=2747483 RepID=A0A8X7BQ32_9ARAC|nr:uncharacterized protein TNIN_337551 [Trichonephila inaurata madagascariensis]
MAFRMMAMSHGEFKLHNYIGAQCEARFSVCYFESERNMDVTQLKTQRKSLLTSFTLSAKTVEEELTKEVTDLNQLSILRPQIGDKFSHLEKFQMDISNLILKEENDEVAYEEDFIKTEKYRDTFSEL